MLQLFRGLNAITGRFLFTGTVPFREKRVVKPHQHNLGCKVRRGCRWLTKACQRLCFELLVVMNLVIATTGYVLWK